MIEKNILGKINFIIGGLSAGGAERVIVTLANSFVMHNIEVTIMCIGRKKVESVYALDDRINLVNIVSGNSHNIIFRKIKQFRKMRNHVKSDKPDVIISFLNYINVQVLLALKNIKIPIIISERNDPYESSRILKILCKLTYPYASSIVFQTYKQQNFFNKKIRKLGKIILNPIRESIEKGEFIYKRSVTNICSIGRLTNQKNHKLLINAIEIIAYKYPNIKLTIYGEGIQRALLEQFITEKNLNNKILMPGNSKNIEEKLKETDIFVLSSDYEGLPNALIEAMCMGIPCVSTKFSGGGAEMLIEDGVNGLLVPTNDVVEFANAIECLIEDFSLRERLGCNATKLYNKVNRNYIVNQWLELLHDIV